MPSSPSKNQARLLLVTLLQRNGYIRRQLADRLSEEGPQSYKKGNEVRFIAKSKSEVAHICELLRIADFKAGHPFVKARQFCIPMYGRDQISEFLALVEKHASK